MNPLHAYAASASCRGAHREVEAGSSGLSCERTRSPGPDDLVGRAAATCTSRRLRLWSRGHTGTCKFLRPSTTLRLGRVDVAVTIGGNVMQRLEFSRGGAIAAKRIEDLERLAIDHVYERVALIGRIDKALFRVR